MIKIKQITAENAADLQLKNEPFPMPGRLIPQLQNGSWSYRTEPFEIPESMVFPDENYTLEEVNCNGVAYGAYENDQCIGLAIYTFDRFRYLYLSDLKVCSDWRGKGVGKALIRAGMEEAQCRNMQGICAIAQDNNLNACLFYLAAGFTIGGFDNRTYDGTSQQGKADVIFYTRGEIGQ